MSILRTVAGLASLAASVSAHGYVSGIVSDGTYYEGTSPSWTYAQTKPDTAGWYANNQDNGYVAPSSLADGDIVCHKGATVGGSPVPVTAGSKVELQWNTWPESHHGPVLDYLAPVSAEAWSGIDKTALSFVKISEGGLVDGSSAPGTWASDQLIANNNSWVVTIPESVAPGKYVLRHEIIALHSAGQEDGAQMYPQCINLEVTGSGSATLEDGEVATSFYKKDDAGILVNIYTTGYDYQIPGPTLWSGAAAAASQTGVAATGTAAASSVASSASAVATSAPVVTSSAVSTSAAAPKTQETSYPDSSSTATATMDAGATTATSSCTTTIYVTATEAVTVTGAAPYSAIATLASAIPSEALTSTLPAYSAAPTGGYSGSENGTIHWGDLPSTPLPEGWCLKDLLQWVAYLLKQSWTKGDQRNHARDFKEASDVKLFKSFAKAML